MRIKGFAHEFCFGILLIQGVLGILHEGDRRLDGSMYDVSTSYLCFNDAAANWLLVLEN